MSFHLTISEQESVNVRKTISQDLNNDGCEIKIGVMANGAHLGNILSEENLQIIDK